MREIVRVQISHFLTNEDVEVIKKWAKENNVALKDLALDMGTTYSHLLHMMSARRSISTKHILYLKERGITFRREEREIHK
jgi:hypothetical protein